MGITKTATNDYVIWLEKQEVFSYPYVYTVSVAGKLLFPKVTAVNFGTLIVGPKDQYTDEISWKITADEHKFVKLLVKRSNAVFAVVGRKKMQLVFDHEPTLEKEAFAIAKVVVAHDPLAEIPEIVQIVLRQENLQTKVYCSREGVLLKSASAK